MSLVAARLRLGNPKSEIGSQKSVVTSFTFRNDIMAVELGIEADDDMLS